VYIPKPSRNPKGQKWTTFTPPATTLCRRYRGRVLLRRSHGVVEQQNFPDYEPLRMRDIKAIEVHIVKTNEAPSGIGEPGTPPAGPALANAIAASGRDLVTHLPMIENGLDFA